MVEMGDYMKQMADVKYSLDDNIKQNFLEPLHHLQTKDLKEVMVNWVGFFDFGYGIKFPRFLASQEKAARKKARFWLQATPTNEG